MAEVECQTVTPKTRSGGGGLSSTACVCSMYVLKVKDKNCGLHKISTLPEDQTPMCEEIQALWA